MKKKQYQSPELHLIAVAATHLLAGTDVTTTDKYSGEEEAARKAVSDDPYDFDGEDF